MLDVIEESALARGDSPSKAVEASALGRPFNVRSGSTAFRQELAWRVAAHNLERGERAGAAIDGDLRAALRTELGREWFVRDVGRGPHERREHPQVEDERPSTSAT